jgi:uncharacterized protein with PIN domain
LADLFMVINEFLGDSKMTRIERGFSTKFRTLLESIHARRIDRGVQWLLERARSTQVDENISPTQALGRVGERLLRQVRGFRNHQVNLGESARGAETILFFCDAGLGGLARWLRAAGYDARWEEGIHDDELLRRSDRLGAILLTTDSLLMERNLIRNRVIPAVWVPPAVGIPDQLAMVFQELDLSVQSPRCMACGGDLNPVQKEAARERIPPKTYRWRDEYFQCSRCDKLFWLGTHWEKITSKLSLVLGQARIER